MTFRPALCVTLALLSAPFAARAASSCSAGDCLRNSAVAQKADPTSITTDDKGDATFFSTQSGQLPNVLFVLDNSTSMYEIPYDVHPFPNSYWVTVGRTPNGCGLESDDPYAPTCPGTAFAQTLGSCHNNSFFEGLKDKGGAPFNKATTYALPDPWFDGTHTPAIKYFQNDKVFQYMEWDATQAGGVNNGGPIIFKPGVGSTNGVLNPGTVSGSINSDCAALTSYSANRANSGGKGGTGNGAWSMTEQQRCQMCLDEAGYYIAPGAGTTEASGGASPNILFKGNWLDFNPPKFIIARKSLTDFIQNQTGSATPVRIGVVSYDPYNGYSTDIPVPDTNGFNGRNDSGNFVSNGMIPDCDVTSWSGATAQSQQSTLLSNVRAISWGSLTAGIGTPLAETLFHVGQFFGGDNAFYTSLFGSQWLKTTGGAMNSGFTAPTGANKPNCVTCQVNAIVLITDGDPQGDNNLPDPATCAPGDTGMSCRLRHDYIECTGGNAAAPAGCGTDQINGSNNLLDDVTNFLAVNDLSTTQVGVQNVITFVIGIGLQVPLLDNAARYGKSSRAVRADNAQDLQQSILNAVVNIIARATAFSSTAIQTLEVGTGSTAFVPRFVPGSPGTPIWDGHLFRFDLFNEFVAGVDLNGDGSKNGVFLVDRDKDIVTEDDKGAFHKLKNNAPAIPIWDAGDTCGTGPACPTGSGINHLNAPGAYAGRTIYTAVYDTTTSAWQTIPFTGTITDANFTKIKGYLGLTGNNVCSTIQAAMASPIDPAYLSATGTFDADHCAKAVIDYARGYNILDEVAGTHSVNVNRPRMLGDIFHSSPVVVDPPVDQFICSLGLSSQCVSTLFGYNASNALVTPTDTTRYTVGTRTGIDAYEKYWEDHETRQRIVLVGANDGMLHAFDAGSPTTSPPTLNSSVGFRQVVYSDGTGNEVWAFVPPDQLARLATIMTEGHQMSMDGDIMVRDVWVDGAKNDKGTAGYVNDVLQKQDVEYHTVAVASERQGGSHFTALDITDTTTPKMLWNWPPPCSPEEQSWGQTFGQFSPRAPPIGPVLLATSNPLGPPNYNVAHTEERWAVFLNGGHSPFNTRGRGVAMLDVYTGKPLFEQNYTPGAADPSAQMKFGFAAAATMIDYGVGDSFAADGFFDTAIIGDEGGQIWTFRFGVPGTLDATTGLATNWAFGRAYEPNTGSTNDARYHQPIYTMAAATVETDNGWLRAFVGTGDRSHVRSSGGGDCRPDDPLSCIDAGCTVNSSVTMDNGPNHYTSTYSSAVGSSATSPSLAAPAQSQTSVVANSCVTASVNETIAVSACPATAMNFSETLAFSCSGVTPYACSNGTFRQPTPNVSRAYSTTPPTGGNDFLSVAILADQTGCSTNLRSRRMSASGDQAAYDAGRLSGFNSACADLVDVSSTTATATAVTGPMASRSSAGWMLKYPTIDEKTVTSSTILGGCVIWSSLIPAGGAVGCASAGSTIAPFYQADAVTGAPNCATSFLGAGASPTGYVRSIQRNVISPPPEPAAAVAIGAGGTSIRFSTLEIQPGASEVTQMTVGTSTEMLQMMYSLPLTYDQHYCRHIDPSVKTVVSASCLSDPTTCATCE